mmetsp:Transcript_43505/g.64558  ORF Transcript_43505/g.64558 Transcript_43505/m.64558 type:complete len:92 (+) Transcript_43505:2-277(+)
MSALETKRTLGSLSDAELLSLPSLLEKNSRAKMRLLSMAFLNSYYRYNEDWMVLIMRRLLYRTIKLGWSKRAPLAFVTYEKTKGNSYFVLH